MPVKVTYPGVYIQELPSGQHTITGVATSITAFVGRAPIGPVDDVITVFSFGDFERFYGGLSYNYPMSYAVRDFFLNGGSQAVIARVFQPEGTGAATLKFPNPPLPEAEGWQISGLAQKGDTSLDLVDNGLEAYEAEVGDTFAIAGDSTTYSVTKFSPPKKTTDPQSATTMVQFKPALAQSPCPCAVLTFKRGPEPSDWMISDLEPLPENWKISTVSGSNMTIEGGTIDPRAGDTFTVSGHSNSYTVETYNPGTFTLTVHTDLPTDLNGASLIFTKSANVVIIHSGTDLKFTVPPPTGWKALKKAAVGTSKITIEGGRHDPIQGDTFTVGTNTYTVTNFSSGSSTITIKEKLASTIDKSKKLQFKPRTLTGWKTTQDVEQDTNSITIEGGQTHPSPGDTFTVKNSANTSYTVKSFSSSSLTITTAEKIVKPVNVVVILNGTGAPKIGDIFSYRWKGGEPTDHVVTEYTPASTDNKLASINFIPAINKPIENNTSLTFRKPSSPPAPIGWKVFSAQKVSKSGNNEIDIVITGGSGVPLNGDVFTVGSSTHQYTVLKSSPVSSSTQPLQYTITTQGDQPSDFPPCSKLTFTRKFPTAWSIPDRLAKGSNKMTISGGQGVIEPGMLFYVGADESQPYEVKYFGKVSKKSIPNPHVVKNGDNKELSESGDNGGQEENTGDNGSQEENTGSASDDNGDQEENTESAVSGGGGDQGNNYDLYFLPEFDGDPSTEINFIPQLTLVAANPGKWGNSLKATAEKLSLSEASPPANKLDPYGLTPDDLFNLSVIYTDAKGKTTSEQFLNVSVKYTTTYPPYPRRLDLVLKNQSQLVRVQTDLSEHPGMLPPKNGSIAVGKHGTNSAHLNALTYIGNEHNQTGIYLLDKTSLFNILCIPPDQRGGDQFPEVYTTAVAYCTKRRAMLIVDPPNSWTEKVKSGEITEISPVDPKLGINGLDAENAAIYFPRILEQDLEMNGQIDVFPACGMIAGLWAATDARRGVWKAPAGQDVGLLGITGLEIVLTEEQNGVLNPLGINCLRTFPVIGPVVWGARTLRGANQLESDYKYIPVRRLTDYIEDSLMRGTMWAVFEPNNEALWSGLRLSVGGFMAQLSREGAFYSYTVACDSTTTTQRDIDQGIVNIVVQFAPVKPAEFVVITIQQQAGKKS